MRDSTVSRITREIERLERQWDSLFGERENARRLHASWTFRRGALRWHVPLEDVIEPDVDVEILPSVLVVRAPSASRRDILFVGLLPVPEGYDALHARIRAERGYLEVTVCRLGKRARS